MDAKLTSTKVTLVLACSAVALQEKVRIEPMPK